MFNLIKLNLNVVQCYMIIPNDSWEVNSWDFMKLTQDNEWFLWSQTRIGVISEITWKQKVLVWSKAHNVHKNTFLTIQDLGNF